VGGGPPCVTTSGQAWTDVDVYMPDRWLRAACEKAGLAYVGILACDFLITVSSSAVIRTDPG
jgi:hypothetical protein